MADDPLAAALAEIEGNILQAEQAGMGRDLDRTIYTHGLVTGTARRLSRAVDAALACHQRVPLYGNAATEDDPQACSHSPDSDWDCHFEDPDGTGIQLCEGKPEGVVCGTCTEEGLPVAWPCPEYSAIAAARNGKESGGG